VGALQTLKVLCGLVQDAKVSAIFDLYDFDGRRRLSRVEIEIMMDSCLNGIAKVTTFVFPRV
jgi:hypothetical protein